MTSESEAETIHRSKANLKTRRRRPHVEELGAASAGEDTAGPSGTDCAFSLSPGSSDHEDATSEDSLESSDSHAPMSAEGIALCLLRDFRDKPLPKASELIWLVSENDVPQK